MPLEESSGQTTALSRREFLRASGAAGLFLALSRLQLACGGSDGQEGKERFLSHFRSSAGPSYRSWEDVYRDRWTWDRVVRGTHTMTNCVSGCAWDLFVKDGLVWREEQTAPYAASRPGLPDFNPRGCQKGACAAALGVSPTRILYPLRRRGERGEGSWERISWDRALETIARKVVDTLAESGPEAVVCELGPNIGAGPNSAAPLRFFRLLGSPVTDSMAQIGDLSLGATIAFGNGHPCGSSDDWFRSSCLVLWTFNPSATRIPDAHFVNEARYGGSFVVCVAPDYNASAIHADLWVPVRPGTDAALALGLAHILVEEGLYDRRYVAEQTDLPFLVRTDTGHFLRPEDFGESGREGFYLRDEKSGEVRAAPLETLELGPLVPELEFEGSVETPQGPVPVATVFRLLRKTLEREYAPERVSALTGVSPRTLRLFAREYARRKPALILSQWGQCKFLHGDLAQRAQILLAALSGNVGRPGGGWRAGGFFAPEGFALLAMEERLDLLHLASFAVRNFFRPEEGEKRFRQGFVPGTIWHAIHGGLARVSGEREHGDRTSPRSASDSLQEALDRKWFPVHPPPGKPPKVLVSIFGNVLRHGRNPELLLRNLWPRLDLVVHVDFRMCETARWADIVLPAAFWYEKTDLKYLVSFVPYVHLGDRAVEPRGEAKPEWEIFSLLARAVAREARRRNLPPYRDIAGIERDARRLDDAFSSGGKFQPGDEERALEFVLRVSSPTRGIGLAELRERGAVRLRGTGPPGGMAGYYSDYAANDTLAPHRWFVEKKKPWPTLTRRQQFYVDHPWFLECGEALPAHKDPPSAGGDYPLVLSGGHTRWSIHAQWRDQALLLRLQRGEPAAYVNPEEARRRGIRDHDRIRVFNDLGSFVARAKLASYVRPGEVIVYHAWEPYQFPRGRSHHFVTPSPFKATNLVGDYGHLRWSYAHWEPNQVDRDTRVELERLEEAGSWS
ncbi:MAG: hypothetical protein KatS3mg076_1416 [Candidatus Binatia bacterium]|nr:MAG: hypothetical protein KatS3mg076_1416 [Candidatus Binatia bacterium]